MKFKWQGVTLEGNKSGSIRSGKKTSWFMEITGRVPKKVQCETRGHLWPRKGSIVLAEELIRERKESETVTADA